MRDHVGLPNSRPFAAFGSISFFPPSAREFAERCVRARAVASNWSIDSFTAPSRSIMRPIAPARSETPVPNPALSSEAQPPQPFSASSAGQSISAAHGMPLASRGSASPSAPRPRLAIAGMTSARTAAPDAAIKEVVAAIDKGNAPRLRQLLSMLPRLMTERTAAGHTLLTHAVSTGNRDAVHVILQVAGMAEALAAQPGTDDDTHFRHIANLPDAEGRTALAHAALQGDEGIAKLLLGLHAAPVSGVKAPLFDVNLPDRNGLTPLNLALRNMNGRRARGAEHVALAILERSDALPDLAPGGERTPMQLAIERASPAIVRAIGRHPNADPNMLDAKGRTPLWQVLDKWEDAVNYHGRSSHWESMLNDLVANPRVDPQARHASGRTLLTHIVQIHPHGGALAHPAIVDLHVQWLNTTLTGILHAARGREDFDLRAIDNHRHNAFGILEGMVRVMPRYRQLLDLLRAEEPQRGVIGALKELDLKRAALGSAKEAAPEQKARARSYIGRIDEARAAALNRDLPKAKGIAQDILESIDDDVGFFADGRSDTAPIRLLDGDHESISRQMMQIVRIGELLEEAAAAGASTSGTAGG